MRWRFRPGHGGGLDQCCDPYLLGFILDKPFSADPGICRDLSYPQEYLSFRTFVSSRLPSFPFTFSPPSCPQRISDLLPVAAIMAPALLPLACLEAPMPHRLLLLIGCCCRRGRERFRMPMSHPQGRNIAESDRVAYWTGFIRRFPAIRGPARSHAQVTSMIEEPHPSRSKSSSFRSSVVCGSMTGAEKGNLFMIRAIRRRTSQRPSRAQKATRG
jgi:hypothetical protein